MSNADEINREIQQIARENREGWAGKALIAIVEESEGVFSVHQHFPDGVAPSSDYPNARAAVSRVMQLMRIGPVAPQTHAETACIGEIDTAPNPEESK
jgi:hypothetical protein